MDGQHGGCKGWTWLYRGPEVGTMPSCTRAGLPMVAGRGSEVKKESRIRVTNPEDGAQSAHGCTEGVRKVCKGSAEVHGRVCKGSMEVHGRVCKGSVEVRGRVRRWGRSPGRVGGWCRCGGCRPSAEKVKSRKFSKNFRKCACFDRAYHENLTWRGLMGVAQGQEVCGGSAS